MPDQAVTDYNSHNYQHLLEQNNRELQDGACGFIGLFLPGSYTCDCGLGENLLALEFTFTCTATTAFCFPLCIQPSISGTIGLGRNTARLEVCNNGFDNSGSLSGPAFTLPPFCANLGGRTEADVFADTHDSRLDECSITSGNQTCDSCEVCDGGLGYKFNCSNIDEHMVQSTCVNASVMSSFNPNNQFNFGLKLDGL